MVERWKGWDDEPPRRRAFAVASYLVVAVLAVIVVGGTLFSDGGATSPWLWIGLALVPILLWLVRAAGLHRGR